MGGGGGVCPVARWFSLMESVIFLPRIWLIMYGDGVTSEKNLL